MSESCQICDGSGWIEGQNCPSCNHDHLPPSRRILVGFVKQEWGVEPVYIDMKDVIV